MSGNYTKKGGGNPNLRKSSRQEKKAHKNSKFSDNSSSDELQETTQKRSRIINKDTIDEDFVANMPADDVADPTPTFTIHRQAAAAPNSAAETLKKFPTNKALIDAVNNLFLETYESYTGHAKMIGSGEAKRFVIHFQSAEAWDACCNGFHVEFPDLLFHSHDPRQLRGAEDL
ncbi:hypothetical protein C1646_770443 [Rhizophagus diaphanus]|nr:hypothetical protein C1646_770443 [Rhizophagus diaphanus] [Rhizophagus sp. MUCL 43196]